VSKIDWRKKKPVDKCGATRKRIFKSQESGLEFSSTFNDAGKMRFYLCPLCGFWHLTSQPLRS
jgi:hypothetical protein